MKFFMLKKKKKKCITRTLLGHPGSPWEFLVHVADRPSTTLQARHHVKVTPASAPGMKKDLSVMTRGRPHGPGYEEG